MEEFSKSDPLEQSGEPDKEKKESRKKRGWGFLESYLRAFYPERIKDDDKKEEDGAQESSKKSRWEKWTEPLKSPWERLFKDKVEVESVKEASTTGSSLEGSKDAATLPQSATNELKTQDELHQSSSETYTSNQPEITAPEPGKVYTENERTVEPEPMAAEVNEPNLVELPSEIAMTEQTHAQQPDLETPEHVIALHEGASGAAEIPLVQERLAGGDEDMREREERRLKREVHRLEETTRDLRTEKEAIKRQQEKFSHNLEKQYEAYEKLHKETLPKLTRSRERLRARLEPAGVRTPEVQQLQAKESFKKPETPLMRTQPSNERLMELANVSPIVAPEVIQHTVEHAAEQNIAIESAYERRHELKDEPVTARFMAAPHGSIASIGHQQASGASINLSELTKATSQVADQLKIQHDQLAAVPSLQKELYAQAVKGGFWAAIMLLLFIGVLMLAR